MLGDYRKRTEQVPRMLKDGQKKEEERNEINRAIRGYKVVFSICIALDIREEDDYNSQRTYRRTTRSSPQIYFAVHQQRSPEYFTARQ